jgi:hypothetical protein
MVLSFTLLVMLTVLGFNPKPIFYSLTGLASIIGSWGVSMMYVSSMRFAGQRIIKKIPYLGLFGAIGVGLSPRLSISVVRSLFSKKYDFVTTPKYNIDSSSNPKHVVFKKHSKYGAYIEIVFIVITLMGIICSIINKLYIVITSFIIQLLCYLITCYYLRK